MKLLLLICGIIILSGCINEDKQLQYFKNAKRLCENINGEFEKHKIFPGLSDCFIIRNGIIQEEYSYTFINNEIVMYKDEGENK